MDFDIATRRLQQDQRAAYAKVRASQRAQKASATARRAAAASKLDAERRVLQKKLESEKHDRIVDQIGSLIRRVERELGVRNVAIADLPPPPPSSFSATATKAMEQSIGTTNNAGSENNHQHHSKQPHKAITFESSNNGSSSSSFFAKGYTLSATSIHGVGDKITLPPSVLETLFASSSSSSESNDPWDSGISSKGGRPIAFRIGVRNTDYNFPSSEKMKTLVDTVSRNVEASIIASSRSNASSVSTVHESSTHVEPTNINDDGENENEEAAMGSDMEEEDDNYFHSIMKAYMDELSHRYLSYTHGTVVEFTEEEGHVGLPEPVANALLRPNIHSLVGGGGGRVDIPITRTVDAAAISNADDAGQDLHHNHTMDTSTTPNTTESDHEIRDGGGDETNEDKTPGHPAYGRFDIPALPIEIIPIYNLPPGKQCTFTPTSSSIQNGFYSLKDVKLVLEQSLMRTRATLSRGDVIRTWRRGVSYDLIVSTVEPNVFGVVSCVNTDMNVDIGPPDAEADGKVGDSSSAADTNGGGGNSLENGAKSAASVGRILSEVSSRFPQSKKSNNELILPPEPGEDIKVGVCRIQIHGRNSSGSNMVTGRRRFLIGSTTMKELFAFASQTCCDGADPMTFRLVTRFPRRVYALASSSSSSVGDEGCFDGDMTLETAGIGQGQEMFMVEMI